VLSAAGARFSRCRRWRYLLWRCWDASRPAANFVMLNPSTADELRLDPTCTRARRYAEAWGYGAILITNVFAFRETDPNEMMKAKDPVGPGNDAAIARAARRAAIVVCAWGNHGAFLGRSGQVRRLLDKEKREVFALRLNAGGEPAHPLYLPARLRPRKIGL
jgi:hypothetical protein